MARVFVRLSSTRLEAAWTGPTAVPLTFAAWVKLGPMAANESIINLGTDGSGNNRFTLETLNTAVGVARSRTTSSAAATGTTTLVAGTTRLLGADFASATSRTFMLDGVADGSTNTTSSTPSAPNEIEIGGNNAANHCEHTVSHVAIWSTTLTAAEWLALFRRWEPRDIRPDALVDWWQLLGNDSPEQGYKRSHALTVINSPAKADGVGLITRRPRSLWRIPAAVGGGLGWKLAGSPPSLAGIGGLAG